MIFYPTTKPTGILMTLIFNLEARAKFKDQQLPLVAMFDNDFLSSCTLLGSKSFYVSYPSQENQLSESSPLLHGKKCSARSPSQLST